MAMKAKKLRRRYPATARPATESVAPQIPPAEAPVEDKKQPLRGDNYAVDVAPDRIDTDPKRLDRENPVCSLPPERDEAPPDG